MTKREMDPEPPEPTELREQLRDLVQDQLIHYVEWMIKIAMARVARADKPITDYMRREMEIVSPRSYEMFFLGGGVHDTGATVLKLCQGKDFNSAYILARSLIERSINLSYLSICEDAEFQAWRNYSYQKDLRLINTDKRVGSFDASIEHLHNANLKDDPELKPLFDPFTGKGGGEITRWSSKTLDQRLEYVEGKFHGSVRLVAMLAVQLAETYVLGAEAMHGTFLGLNLNFFTPARTSPEYHRVALELAVISSAYAGICVLSNFANRPDWFESVKSEFDPLFKEYMKASGIDPSNPR